MGLGEVWSMFPESTKALIGPDAVRAVEGKVICIDAAIWIVEAISQAALRKHFDTKAAVLKVFFDRIFRWLTIGGITPVVCIEGDSRGDRAGRKALRGPQFRRRCEDVKLLMAAMGVPCVQSEGEAEACCAALGAAGLVTGIHSKDSDVLSFGVVNKQSFPSALVYRELHMDISSKLCRAQILDVDSLYRVNQLEPDALIGIFALLGNEYEGTDTEGEVCPNQCSQENHTMGNHGTGEGGTSNTSKKKKTNIAAKGTYKRGWGKGKGGKGRGSVVENERGKGGAGAKSIGKKTALPVLRALCRLWRKAVQTEAHPESVSLSAIQNVQFLDFMINEFEFADLMQRNDLNDEVSGGSMEDEEGEINGSSTYGQNGEQGRIPVFVRSVSQGRIISNTSLFGYYRQTNHDNQTRSFQETPLVELTKCKKNSFSLNCPCLYCKTVSSHFSGVESWFQDHRCLLKAIKSSTNSKGVFIRRLKHTSKSYRRPPDAEVMKLANSHSVHAFVWKGFDSNRITDLLEDVYESEQVTRRLIALSLEWSLRNIVSHRDDWSAKCHRRLRDNEQVGGFSTGSGGIIVGVSPDHSNEDIIQLEEVMQFALSNPHLNISHIPIGVDKMDLDSPNSSSSSSSDMGTNDGISGMLDGNSDDLTPSSTQPVRALVSWLFVCQNPTETELLKTKSAPDRFARISQLHSLGGRLQRQVEGIEPIGAGYNKKFLKNTKYASAAYSPYSNRTQVSSSSTSSAPSCSTSTISSSRSLSHHQKENLVIEFIKSRRDIWEAILCFEPVSVDSLLQELRKNKLICSKELLKSILNNGGASIKENHSSTSSSSYSSFTEVSYSSQQTINVAQSSFNQGSSVNSRDHSFNHHGNIENEYVKSKNTDFSSEGVRLGGFIDSIDVTSPLHGHERGSTYSYVHQNDMRDNTVYDSYQDQGMYYDDVDDSIGMVEDEDASDEENDIILLDGYDHEHQPQISTTSDYFHSYSEDANSEEDELIDLTAPEEGAASRYFSPEYSNSNVVATGKDDGENEEDGDVDNNDEDSLEMLPLFERITRNSAEKSIDDEEEEKEDQSIIYTLDCRGINISTASFPKVQHNTDTRALITEKVSPLKSPLHRKQRIYSPQSEQMEVQPIQSEDRLSVICIDDSSDDDDFL